MIARVWHGWTTSHDADRYERLLLTQVLPDIQAMGLPGYRGAELFRRVPDEWDGEVEFMTVLRFDSLDDVRSFTGADYQVAHVPPEARALLVRFDARSQHYDHIPGDGG